MPKSLMKQDENDQNFEEEPEQELSEAAQVELVQLQGLLKYYQDALRFSQSINESCTCVADLLSSSLKTEVVSSMRFFVTAHRFELQGAQVSL
jgi:hypothetical protein